MRRAKTSNDPCDEEMIMIEDHSMSNLDEVNGNERFEKFMNMIRGMEETLPSPSKMLHYANFLEEVIAKREIANGDDVIGVKETCDAIVTSEVAIKLDDPGSFSIPCVVGTQKVDRALCDLGASVSVIPLAIAKRLDVKNLTRASFTIKLADGTSKSQIGLLKDIMVKVGNLTIPGRLRSDGHTHG